MPLPLIPAVLGGGAIATAVFGVKKAIDAYDDSQTAEAIHKKAKKEYNKAEKEVNSKREQAQSHFELLGYLQADIVKGGLQRYEDIIDKLNIKNNVDLQDVVGKETLDGLANIQQSIISLETTLGGFASGALAGAITGFGMYGGAGLFASASTGTAIASLSGVAATNATLAWFGGGSLAAGGLGIAGGTVVLGGIVAAPVIAVVASVFAAKAEEKKYDAYVYYDSVEAICESMRAEGFVWEQISNKAKEKKDILKKLNTELNTQVDRVESIMANKGITDIKNSWNDDEHRELKILMQLAEVIVITINAPIMNDEDRLTKELIRHQKECKELMEEIQRKWGDKQDPTTLRGEPMDIDGMFVSGFPELNRIKNDRKSTL